MNMINNICKNCGAAYPVDRFQASCPECGGSYTLSGLDYDPSQLGKGPGMWAYSSLFDAYHVPAAYLGEGQTPLIQREVDGHAFYAKMESLNPSGSFKDRNAAYLTALLKSWNITKVIEDSSGNAGAALAFYCAAFGIEAHIFVPENTSGPKIRQIKNCGARINYIAGERINAQKAAIQQAESGNGFYASHAALPFGMAAYATIAFEIFEQLGKLPDRVFAPIGHGSLFYGILLGFGAVARYYAIKRPAMIGVQPAVCAPLVKAWHNEVFDHQQGKSLAEGAVITRPVRGDEILKALVPGFDDVIAIEETDIAEAVLDLTRSGLYVEPTSALVYAALKHLNLPENDLNVLVFTGNGLKSELEF